VDSVKGVHFDTLAEDAATRARAGVLHTPHGPVHTPVFMPVGTQGTVKGLTPAQLEELGAEIILGNTYHLLLRPGIDVISGLGGLHRFAAWPRALLTDSGGYQVYSLLQTAEISDAGVVFRSHLDGARVELTPAIAVAAQEALGSDIMMVLDHCPPAGASRAEVQSAMDRTHRWAEAALACRRRFDTGLFAIAQGGTFADTRRASARALADLPFEGYAIGGLSVGETRTLTWEIVALTAEVLPRDKPRYLMGVGTPEDLLTCVGHGVDMFDCVLPTRNARNGRLLTLGGDLNVRNTRWRTADRPVEEGCACYTCRHFTLAYLRHLERAGEMLFCTLASIHNLHFLLDLMRRARLAILEGRFDAFQREMLARRAEQA
jgi:queuine tRNA-ribosyltransferase